MAGIHPLQTGGRHGDALTVKGAHRLGRQCAAANGRCPLHGRHGFPKAFLLLEIRPERTAPFFARRFQRGDLRRQAVGTAAVTAFHRHRGEQAAQALHHKGRPQLAAGHIRRRIADPQAIRGLGQRRIEALEFDVHTIRAAGRQFDLHLCQGIAVILVENAAALARIGDNMIVDAQQKQVAHGMSVIAGDLADIHLIQRGGDGAHAVLGQHLAEQADELVRSHGLLTQQLHKLIQHATEDLPQLGCFLRFLKAAGSHLVIHLTLEGLLQADLLHKAV